MLAEKINALIFVLRYIFNDNLKLNIMFTGNEDQTITLAAGSSMTANYRAANPDQILGHFFGKKILTDILSQANCVGIRVYYAIKDDGSKELVLVGVDSAGNDLCNGVLGDRSYKSPPYSGASNPLNS